MPLSASEIATNQPSMILVVGAPGEPEYSSNFVRQVQLWTETCHRADAHTTVIGLCETNTLNDRDQLHGALESQPTDTLAPLWLVLVGHGTFDGKEARFNLRGPDISPDDLAQWLKPFHRPLVIIDTSSASAPFLNTLSATNRVIITATRNGNEVSFSHFGQYLAEAMDDLGSDLDKDQQVSLLEAFVTASAHVAEFYKNEDRLATEHALLDDNGDQRGTPADWYRGLEVVKKPEKGAVDGARAHQIHLVLSQAEQSLPTEVRTKRNALELQLAQLRDQKSSMDENDYYRRIEKVLLELARLYETNAALPSNSQEPMEETAK